MNEFKLIKTLKKEQTRDSIILSQLFRYKNRVFKFYFDNSNGTPLGFDSKHCIKVFNIDTNEWKNIADDSDIDSFANKEIKYDWVYSENEHAMDWAIEFMEACKRYVEVLYGN